MTDTIPVLKILIVEDDDSKISEWKDAIESHNADSESKGFEVDHVVSKSVSDAKRQIEFHRFDAAVVDLRLQVEEGVAENNSHGNELVRHIIATQPLGVVVHTGQRSEADEEGYGVPQVQVMDKGDGLEQVFTWLALHMNMFLRLRAARATFDRETAKVFFRSIWPRWKHWTNGDALDAGALADVVARHVVAHVHDALLSAGGDATHPEESYFVPPLKSRLDTGDLLDFEGRTWIVVSPRCDLANQGKVRTVLLAACEDISGKWEPLNAPGKEKERNKVIQHEQSPKQHFLLPLRDQNSNQRGPWMIQFHDILALPADQALKDLPSQRFASLSPLFVPSLVERFGGYFSRIGTPGFSSD